MASSPLMKFTWLFDILLLSPIVNRKRNWVVPVSLMYDKLAFTSPAVYQSATGGLENIADLLYPAVAWKSLLCKIGLPPKSGLPISATNWPSDAKGSPPVRLSFLMLSVADVMTAVSG